MTLDARSLVLALENAEVIEEQSLDDASMKELILGRSVDPLPRRIQRDGVEDDHAVNR